MEKPKKTSVSAKNELGLSKENLFWDSHLREKESETKSILMSESLPIDIVDDVEKQNGVGNGKKKHSHDSEEKSSKSGKKNWGFDGFKKWKRSDTEEETAPLPLTERSDSESPPCSEPLERRVRDPELLGSESQPCVWVF